MSLALVAVLVSGCGDRRPRLEGPTAATVNGEAVTVPLLNLALQQQRGLRPDQLDAAGRQVLERLIDQELAAQKARDLRLDLEPKVALQLEAARREVLARAYADKLGEAAAKPGPEEVRKYYDDKPALFGERRIYSLQEIAVESRPEQMAMLRERLQASKHIGEFVEYLKANDFRFAGNQAVRAAEQLPLASLDAFARMHDGQAVVVPSATGLQVIVLAGSHAQPVTLEQARPAIEQFILNDRRRKLVEADIKGLRAAAKIVYQGTFAEQAAPAASAASEPAPLSIVPSASAVGTK